MNERSRFDKFSDGARQALRLAQEERYKVRDAVEFLIGHGVSVVHEEIGQIPRAKKVIELAVGEAHRLKHHAIGTENLLFGLVREGKGLAVGILESMGVR